MAGHQYQGVHKGRSLACVVIAEVLLHKLETWQMLSCLWFIFYASACANISSKLHCYYYSLTQCTRLIICFSTSWTSCSAQWLWTHDIWTAGSTTIHAIVSNQLFEKDTGLTHSNCIGICGAQPVIILICPSQTYLNKRVTVWDVFSQIIPPLYQHFESWICTTQHESAFTWHALLGSMGHLVYNDKMKHFEDKKTNL